MFEQLELLNEALLLSELPKLWLSRRLGGNSKWYDVSVDSENGGRARMPYVVGRSSGFLDSINFNKLYYKINQKFGIQISKPQICFYVK